MDKETAIKVLKELHDKSLFAERTALETLIPELAESEDERIRKEIINYFAKGKEYLSLCSIGKDDILAWLEKQGKKSKPSIRERYKRIANSEWFEKTHEGMSISDDEDVDNINKIEPKFKVGDWIIYSNEEVHLITDFDDNGYFVDDKEYYIPFNCEGNMRLWTIADAKDGDVLTNGNFPCIFKRCDGNGSLYVYCGINAHNDFSILSEDPENVWDDYSKQYFPATKEQRDTLFAKMKESGYEWLEETKELKKIERKPMLSDFFNAEYERGKADALKSAEWSDEDLNNIADRFMPEPVWNALEESEGEGSNAAAYDYSQMIAMFKAGVHWLKSLKYRYTWKPSDMQMNAFEQVYDWYNNNFAPSETLTSLYNDLKKLREE